MMIGDVLTLYGQEHAPTTAAPERIGYAIAALEPVWAGLPVSTVKGATCRRYARQRGVSAGTTRRALGVMHAALVHCERAAHLTSAPMVTLPERPPSKDRWLTRDEAARLLRAARALPRARHLARFILIGLYTGTRKSAILRLQWHSNTEGGHVDLERGMLYRKSSFARKTKKRQPPVKIPRPLLAHLRRWRRLSRQHVVEYEDRPVRWVLNAWAKACARAGLDDVNRHTLRHTAITWAMQRGVKLADAAGFFGVGMVTLEAVYFHQHPDFQKFAVEAMERK
jgi:integrase